MTNSICIVVSAALAAAVAASSCAEAGAPDLDPVTRDVVIDARDVRLGATLYLPADAELPLPGFVIAHGSAPSTRNDVGFYTDLALSMGFAVVAFDKRGVGESTGEYVPFHVETSAAVFKALAEDVAYAARWLAEQPEIDASRIGVLGGSQAGWIMPLAASNEPRISFIVVGEGVPVTAGEENAHSAVTGDGDWDESAVAKADLALLSFHGPHGYDPAPVLEHLDIPVLWIFGLRDAVIPVTRSLGILESLIANGRTNHTVRVLPFGDHNFKNRAIGKRYDLRAVVEPWLREIGALENRADFH